jgi:hypothetical protein
VVHLIALINRRGAEETEKEEKIYCNILVVSVQYNLVSRFHLEMNSRWLCRKYRRRSLITAFPVKGWERGSSSQLLMLSVLILE